MAESKKSKKVGRSKKSSQNLRYINEKRHAKSHARRMAKHLRKYPEDTAVEALLQLLCRVAAIKVPT